MCPLGKKPCEEHNTVFDPHVFSSLTPSKWVIYGQNPGYNECCQQMPFVGLAGQNFDEVIKANGVSRKTFYISNIVRCHTINNEKPDYENTSSCEPILRLELGILKPKLVITLGQVAFDNFCPGKSYSDSLGKIILSQKYSIKVFPTYHPSPRNMQVTERREKFIKDITLLCKLIKKLS
jgi:DNA polymerase